MVRGPWEGMTLAIDASTYTGTIAVLRDGLVVARASAQMRGDLEERLMPAVLAALAGCGCGLGDIGRVVCGSGPGSFTSLRIAGAISKGLAMGNGVPLLAVSSLTLIVAANDDACGPGRWLALLDAMRHERFAAIVDVGTDGTVREAGAVRRIPVGQIAVTCEQLGARAVGPLESTNAAPDAAGVARLLDVIGASGPVSLDQWEPAYGRLAEAQVKWEALHGGPLPS